MRLRFCTDAGYGYELALRRFPEHHTRDVESAVPRAPCAVWEMGDRVAVSGEFRPSGYEAGVSADPTLTRRR